MTDSVQPQNLVKMSINMAIIMPDSSVQADISGFDYKCSELFAMALFIQISVELS